MVDSIRALSEPKTVYFLYTPSDNRARNFCCIRTECVHQVHCAVFRCVGSSRNVTYVGFNFRRDMTITITLFPDVALSILVPAYQTTMRHVLEVLIFKIPVLRILCYYMTYDYFCSEHHLFQRGS
jgi:hypothetical protein